LDAGKMKKIEINESNLQCIDKKEQTEKKKPRRRNVAF